MLTLQGVESHNAHTLGVAAVVSAAGRFFFWGGGEIAIHIHNFFRIQSCPSGCQIKPERIVGIRKDTFIPFQGCLYESDYLG